MEELNLQSLINWLASMTGILGHIILGLGVLTQVLWELRCDDSIGQIKSQMWEHERRLLGMRTEDVCRKDQQWRSRH